MDLFIVLRKFRILFCIIQETLIGIIFTLTTAKTLFTDDLQQQNTKNQNTKLLIFIKQNKIVTF